MQLRNSVWRVLLLCGLLAVALTGSGCDTYVGVGVGYGYPGSWGGPWTGGYIGAPVYRP
jgi:hypothetical protein